MPALRGERCRNPNTFQKQDWNASTPITTLRSVNITRLARLSLYVGQMLRPYYYGILKPDVGSPETPT